MTKCWGSKRKKDMVPNAGARQVFIKYGHPYIILKGGITHNLAVKYLIFEKAGHLVWIIFMAVTLRWVIVI